MGIQCLPGCWITPHGRVALSSSSSATRILIAAHPSGLFSPLAPAWKSCARWALQQAQFGGRCRRQRDIFREPLRLYSQANAEHLRGAQGRVMDMVRAAMPMTTEPEILNVR
jgi:hypothetical protein